MLSPDLELVRQIADEIDVINKLLKSKTFDEVINDIFLKRTLIKCLDVIGEASKKISEEFKSSHPDISWRSIIDTRNKIIHDYSGIDYDIIRSIVNSDIPELEFQIKNILNA